MKRSAQVALVLMGVTGTTATAAYLMPSRECRTQPPSATAAGPAAALPQNAATPNEPCRRGSSGGHYYRSWGNWGWGSRTTTTAGRPASSVSTALTGSNSGGRVGAISSGSGSSGSSGSSSASRGGFGSTGHGMSSGS